MGDIELAGKTIFKPREADRLIADMREAMAMIQEKARFASESQRDEVLEVYRGAIRLLRERLVKN
jgi:hypothetical protein